MSEVSQRNNIAQELSTLRAKLKEDQKRVKNRNFRSESDRKRAIRNTVQLSKRIDELEALQSVNKGIDDADRAAQGK